MRRSGWALALSAFLFAAWVGYLAYLAATTTEPVVLDRPQFLIADAYVIAEIKPQTVWREQPARAIAPLGIAAAVCLSDETPPENSPGDVITLKRVIWAAKPGEWKAERIYVRNLSLCVGGKGKTDAGWGWRGPGEYVLALSKSGAPGKSVCFVTQLPRTPGFIGSAVASQAFDSASRIYPLTPMVKEQAEILAARYHP